jgi:putative membrane protein (TIGR04086 family)
VSESGPGGRRISVASILIGELVDKVLFVPLVFGLIYAVGTEGPTFSIGALVIGTACTCIGSFVAATRARDLPVVHGVAVGALTFVLSFVRFLAVQVGDEPSVHSLPWEVTSWTASIGAGYIGGVIARTRVRHPMHTAHEDGRP